MQGKNRIRVTLEGPTQLMRATKREEVKEKLLKK